MLGMGELWPEKIRGYFFRSGLILAGGLLMFPGLKTDVLGLVMAFVILLPKLLKLSRVLLGNRKSGKSQRLTGV